MAALKRLARALATCTALALSAWAAQAQSLTIGVRAGPESIDDPDKLLKWLAKDRATVTFSGKDDIAARKPAVQAVLRQWIRFA